MPHDNVKACEEVFGKLEDNHMMSPTLIRINRTSPWSPCSAAIITDYLDSGHGKLKKATLCIFLDLICQKLHYCRLFLVLFVGQKYNFVHCKK